MRWSLSRRWLGVLGLMVVALITIAGDFGSGVFVESPIAHAQTNPSDSQENVRVATKPLAPFVFADDGELRGYSVDLWDEIARRLGVRTTWIQKEKVGEILDAVQTGEADVAIAGISMTAEREQKVDFTHTYFDSGLQVLVRDEGRKSSFGDSVGAVVNRRLFVPLAVFLGVIVVMGHVIWLAERKHNQDFPDRYGRGIVEAVWWSMVNVITGGDAEKKIRRPVGRLVAAVWMLFGLFLVAFVTATVTSSLTVKQLKSSIEGVNDLYGHPVATVEGSVSDKFLQHGNFDRVKFGKIEEALEGLIAKKADAVVYDAPVLAYYTATQGRGRVRVVGEIFQQDKYGIAVPTGSPRREQISAILLQLSGEGYLQDLYDKWFSSGR